MGAPADPVRHVSDVGVGMAMTSQQLDAATRIWKIANEVSTADDWPDREAIEALDASQYLVWEADTPGLNDLVVGLLESLRDSRVLLAVEVRSPNAASDLAYHVGEVVTVQDIWDGESDQHVFSPLMTRDLALHFVREWFSTEESVQRADLEKLERSDVEVALRGDVASALGHDRAEGLKGLDPEGDSLLPDLAGWTSIWSLRSEFGCAEFALTQLASVWLLPSAPDPSSNPRTDFAIRVTPIIAAEVLNALFPSDFQELSLAV